MRRPISVETQVAVTLYYLSDEGRSRKLANAFGISRSSVSIIIRRFCADFEYLGSIYLRLPTSEREVQIGKLISCLSWISPTVWEL